MYLASESRIVNLYRTAFHFDPLVHDSCTSTSLIPWVCGVSSDVVPSWLFVLAVHGLSPLAHILVNSSRGGLVLLRE